MASELIVHDLCLISIWTQGDTHALFVCVFRRPKDSVYVNKRSRSILTRNKHKVDRCRQIGTSFFKHCVSLLSYVNIIIMTTFIILCTTSAYVHVREMREGRKKVASKVIQTTTQSNTAHPRQSLFLRKMSCLGWDSNP